MLEKLKALASNPEFKKDYTSPEEAFLKRQEERKAKLETIFDRRTNRAKEFDKLLKKLIAKLDEEKTDICRNLIEYV